MTIKKRIKGHCTINFIMIVNGIDYKEFSGETTITRVG